MSEHLWDIYDLSYFQAKTVWEVINRATKNNQPAMSVCVCVCVFKHVPEMYLVSYIRPPVSRSLFAPLTMLEKQHEACGMQHAACNMPDE